MLTIDVLISVTNAHIVRVKEALPQPLPGVNYIISYQYTEDKYLDLIPEQLKKDPDISLYKIKGKGLSSNRNNALKYATGDLVYFIDDDTVMLPNAFDTIRQIFEENPHLDIALFQAQNYAGKPLRYYEENAKEIVSFNDRFKVFAYETVCRRESIQGKLQYNEHFGLGSNLFLCYEQQVWLEDAVRKGLKLQYFPIPIIQTSAIIKPRFVFHDSNIQKALGGLLNYTYGIRAYWKALQFACWSAHYKKAKFWSLLRGQLNGIWTARRGHIQNT